MKFEEYNIADLFMKHQNVYNILEYINTKEYDFSDALNVTISLTDQIFTIDYVKNKINDAITNHHSSVRINGENYDYFKLYLNDGSTFDYEELPAIDYNTLYSALALRRTYFTSSLNDLKINIYYVSINSIRQQISKSKLSEEYVEELILNNVNSSKIKNEISILGNTYTTYNLSIKKYFDKNTEKYIYDKNKERIAQMETHFDEILSVNPKIVQRYYIEYYSDEIKQKIIADINTTRTGKIKINEKEYQYVYFNDESKDLIFDALCSNRMYYINSENQKVSFNIYSKDILLDSARIYAFVPVDSDLLIPKDDVYKGSFDGNGQTYYFTFNTSRITDDLNNIKSSKYTNEDIEQDCISSIKHYVATVNGVEWIKLALIELENIETIEYNDGSVTYKGMPAILHDMANELNGNGDHSNFYNDLFTNQSYTMSSGRNVQLSIMGLDRIRYEMTKDSDTLWNFAGTIEGELSDEYERAKQSWNIYNQSDKANLIDTSIPLPDILPTDSNDEIYRKWSNYYSNYGLFIPDFNYILDYEPIKPSNTQIYNGKDIVNAEYTLYDWLIPLYNVSADGTMSRVSKRINAVIIENDEGIPIIGGAINKLVVEDHEFRDGLFLHNYKINGSEIVIYSTSGTTYPLTITQKLNENNEQYYEFVLEYETNNNYTFTTHNILLPNNTSFDYTTITTPGNNTVKMINIGLDPSIQYNTIKINDKTLEQIENPNGSNISKQERMQNIQRFINNLYIYTVNGVYTGPEDVEELKLSSENFQEYDIVTNSGISDIITITYDIETVYRNVDNTSVTYHTNIELEYPNDLTSLNDMNSTPAFTNYICHRNFDLSKNIYKTFIIDDDLMKVNIDKSTGKPKKYSFSTDNWLYSVKKLMHSTSKTSPYIDVHDLHLQMLTNSVRRTNYEQYMQPVLIKYFIQWINNYDIHLIVNESDYGFSDVSAFIDNNEYKLQVITDNLFSLDYKEVVDNTLEIYSSGSRFKMLIQLL